jgi:hypothetical protein
MNNNHPKLKIYISQQILDSYEYTYTSSTHNNALHDLTLIKLSPTSWVHGFLN